MLQHSQTRQRYLTEFLSALRSDLPLYIMTGSFFLVGTLYVVATGHDVLGMLDNYAFKWSVNFGIFGPLFVFTIGAIHIAMRTSGRKILAYRTMFWPRRLARYIAGTVFLMTGGLLFTSTFSSIKTSFPERAGFPLDQLHADIDKMLHFGIDPFHLLYSFSKHEWVLRVIEMNYNVVWFIVCYFVLYFVVTSPRTNAVRLRFAFTWFGSWIVVGTILASQFLSAGPIYYGRVTGDVARFAEQNAFVTLTSHLPGSASTFQEYLWYLHSSGQLGLGSGISAFPSMHVALITVIALFAGEYSRKLGAIVWAYVALIQFSSVYLGWHYAIDGYVSLVVVTGLYWALRKLWPVLPRLRWHTPVPQPQDTPVFARSQ